MATMPGHKWRVTNTVEHNGSRFFQYTCSKCKTTTLNGMALLPPHNEKCGTSPK